MTKKKKLYVGPKCEAFGFYNEPILTAGSLGKGDPKHGGGDDLTRSQNLGEDGGFSRDLWE